MPVVVLDRCPVSTCRKLWSSQLQFVGQVEPSLFGNRDLYAQCNCAVCSWQGGRVVHGALHTGAGPGGHVDSPHNSVHLLWHLERPLSFVIRPHHHHHQTHALRVTVSRVAFSQNPVVAMSDHAGTSWRRRERRLRSWPRHERMTVAMELAAATHHSSPKGWWPVATHNALRGQKSVSSVGARPAALREPVPQLASEHAACPCSSGAPPLSLLVLADRAADVVDSSSLRFLTASALEARREEEEEEEERQKREELTFEGSAAGVSHAPADQEDHLPALAQGGQEEKEEEEEEEASQNFFLSWPRSSSTTAVTFPMLVSLVQCSRCVLFACRQAKLLDIMDEYLRSSSTLAVACAELVLLVFLFSSRWVPFRCRLAQDAPHHGRHATKGQLCALRSRQWHVQGSFCWYLHLALCSSFGFQAVMTCIVAGMGQRDSYAARLRHAVVHMPVVCNDSCRELQTAENCGFSAVAPLGKVVNIPVPVQTPIPMVLTAGQTIEIPLLLLCKVVDIPVVLVVRVPQVVHIPVITQRLILMVHPVQPIIEISQLQFDKIIDVPVCASCRFSGAGCEETVELPQLQLVEKSLFPYVQVGQWHCTLWRHSSSTEWQLRDMALHNQVHPLTGMDKHVRKVTSQNHHHHHHPTTTTTPPHPTPPPLWPGLLGFICPTRKSLCV